MKILTITCKSTDEDENFKVELDIIIDQLSKGFQSGFDVCTDPDGTSPDSMNSYHYSVQYNNTAD